MATDLSLESAIDTDLGERFYRDDEAVEKKLMAEIIGVISQFIQRRFNEGRRPALRDAHAKDNGCVEAVFRINKDIPAELRHGIFAKEGEYKAWIRFSEANSEVRGPRAPDAHGMAVKVLGVEGPKLVDQDNAQDFIMVHRPFFFIDDLQRYLDTLKVFHSGGMIEQLLSALKLKWPELRNGLRTNFTLIANPLYSQYWSMTSYRLGSRTNPNRMAIKFTAKPRVEPPGFFEKWATILAPGYSLKTEMAKVLAQRDMTFDFYLQKFHDEASTPVENTLVAWPEDVSPPMPVATIFIPKQTGILSDERAELCENLSLNPWHCLAEHKPLGAVNRARKEIYQAISALRHGLNRV